MKNKKTMALYNSKYNTVELFEDIEELKEIIDRFDNIEELKGMKMLSYEDIRNIDNIKIVNFYDEEKEEICEGLTIAEYENIKKKSLQNTLKNDIVNIQNILACNGWIYDIESYLLNNGYKKEVFTRFNNKEIAYIKNNVEVEIINDLEIIFYSGFVHLATVERMTINNSTVVTITYN